MADEEFNDLTSAFADGRLGRRRFVRRLVGGGATFVAANAIVGALGVTPAHAASSAVYGTPPGKGGTPRGLGGVRPPGFGGTPPGQGGTPPGRAKKNTP